MTPMQAESRQQKSLPPKPVTKSVRALIKSASVFLHLLVLTTLYGCQQPSSLDQVRERGLLRIVTRNGPTTFYTDGGQNSGFEYHLAKEFADYLGVKLKMYPVYGRDDILKQLRRDKADIAAAGLTIAANDMNDFRYSVGYGDAMPRVVYKIGTRRPRKIEDLVGKKISVSSNSRYSTLLQQLKQQLPALSWSDMYDKETIDLLEMVREGSIDHTVVNEHEFIAYRGIFSDLSMSLTLEDSQQIGWVLHRKRGKSAALYSELDNFLVDMKNSGRLAELQERFFGHSKGINQVSALEFAANIKRRLPQYEKMFRVIATEYGLPWELLAAMAYQESLWNPKAVSPTGVRGMMMLTKATAAQVDIDDRSNAEQSLRGGAEYFLSIRSRIPEDIAEPDRSWFALAAYNVGMGHVEDARIITEARGDDPHKWMDVKKHLPLLRKRKWYSKTRYGFARGNEPVTYVQNIRHYYDVLLQQEIARTRHKPPIEVSHLMPAALSKPMPAI